MIDLNECVEKGLIRKTVASKEQALAGLKKARVLLKEAEEDFEDERFNSTVVVAYLAILNAARAVLFRDGYRERSHACVARYLEAKYAGKISQDCIDLLDYFRETRHEVQYESDYFAEAEAAKQIAEFAGKFIKLVEELLK
ncbi:HEPN domain-containing protein [Candidatus Micrarchaeota archaeon]|nr:HEPN domain-containing protein [Candidatus Micrarchaeota archaeon]